MRTHRDPIGSRRRRASRHLASAGLAVLAAVAGSFPAFQAVAATQPQGSYVARFNGAPNFAQAHAKGIVFAYSEATEGNSANPNWNTNNGQMKAAGLYHGAVHIARPKDSSGAAQAQYFVAHGGEWSADGMTLPPALEAMANPSGPACYDLTQHAMAAWITDFSNYVHTATGRYPVIATTSSWWNQCTGNLTSPGANDPLWLLRWGSSPGQLPAGWKFYTIWDHADTGPTPGEQLIFNGDAASLKSLATG